MYGLDDHRVDDHGNDHHTHYNHDPNDPMFLDKKGDPRSTEYPDGRKNPETMTYYKSTHGHNNSVINGIGRIGYMTGGKAALWNDEPMADEFIKQTEKYIKSHKDKPFFLYFPDTIFICQLNRRFFVKKIHDFFILEKICN